jgi:hypothetical protein
MALARCASGVSIPKIRVSAPGSQDGVGSRPQPGACIDESLSRKPVFVRVPGNPVSERVCEQHIIQVPGSASTRGDSEETGFLSTEIRGRPARRCGSTDSACGAGGEAWAGRSDLTGVNLCRCCPVDRVPNLCRVSVLGRIDIASGVLTKCHIRRCPVASSRRWCDRFQVPWIVARIHCARRSARPIPFGCPLKPRDRRLTIGDDAPTRS